MKKWIFISSILFIQLLQAEFSREEQNSVLSAMEGDPAFNIDKAVNAISGDYIIHERDFVAPGYQPIEICRTYLSSSQKGRASHFSFFPHIYMYVKKPKQPKKDPTILSVAEPSGSVIHYSNFIVDSGRDAKHFVPIFNESTKGITNTSKGEISGRTNICFNNIFLDEREGAYVLTTADGTRRYYKKPESIPYAYLEKERKTNGNWVLYEYDPNTYNLTEIRTTNPKGDKIYAKIRVIYGGAGPISSQSFCIEYEGQKVLGYLFNREKDAARAQEFSTHLSTVSKAFDAQETLSYTEIPDTENTQLVSKREINLQPLYSVQYYQPQNLPLATSTVIEDDKDPASRRIKSLKQPLGPNGELVETHHFFYKLGKYAKDKKKENKNFLENPYAHTYVFDAYRKKTEYTFDHFFTPHLIARIGSALDNPKGSGEFVIYEENFEWHREPGSINHLIYKFYKDHKSVISSEGFKYDKRGNVSSHYILGNLTGKNSRSIPISRYEMLSRIARRTAPDVYLIEQEYHDNPYSLIKKRKLPNGVHYEYRYHGDSDLLNAMYTIDQGKIKLREFKVYNDDNVLVEEITDNGSGYDIGDLTSVTERRMKKITLKKEAPALNFPEIVEDKYLDMKTGREVLLKRIQFHYDKYCEVSQEDLFDANGVHVFSIYRSYDQKRRLTKVKDSLGRESTFVYNDLNQVIEETRGDSPLKIYYEKDILGRTKSKTTRDSQGTLRCERKVYDLKSRVTETIDNLNNRTTFAYDDLDHEIEKTLPTTLDAKGSPQRPIYSYINDHYGNHLIEKDPLGYVTKSTYTTTGKPTHVIHPDNTEERFYYYPNGDLEEHRAITGLKTTFIYDFLQRPLSKKVYSKKGTLLFEETFKYDAFHLLEKSDERKVLTTYKYDGAGRKIEEIESKSGEFIAKKTYDYDALGREYRSSIHNEDSSLKKVSVKEFDSANRIIEEREEDGEGKIFSKVRYAYDKYDRKIAVFTHTGSEIAKESFTYDDYGRVLTHTDSLGHITKTEYRDHLHNELTGAKDAEVIVTDPLGRKVLQHFSSTNTLMFKERYNSIGTLDFVEHYFYDLVGNKVKQVSKSCAQNKEIITSWEYDCNSRVITQIEALGSPDQKVTRFTYTLEGHEKTIELPDGTILAYDYDEREQLVELKSSDGTIGYHFVYDKMGRVIEEEDLISKIKSFRKYNARGDLLEEILASGVKIQKSYDSFGRKLSMTLPEGSEVHYSYDSYHLKEITKNTPGKDLGFSYSYVDYDLLHQPLKMVAQGSLEIQNAYDIMGRHIGSYSPYFKQQITNFDPCGNVLSLDSSSDLANDSSTFSYDDLDHLINEEGRYFHSYTWDSYHNCLSKDRRVYYCNDLHQLLKEGGSSYSYDKRGSRVKKSQNNQALSYEYDALNRLLALKTDHVEILFTYDSRHRRLSKTVKKLGWYGSLEKVFTEYYIYDAEKEIGALDESYSIKNLKILGLGKGGDIGASVAIQLKDALYIPMHDVFGNIVSLIDAKGGYVAESYRYSAFGESDIYSYYHFSLRDSYLGNPWRFQSKRIDEESSLIFFGIRYYDPKIASWISPDPMGIEEGINLYQYLQGCPYSHMDIYGLSVINKTKPSDLDVVYSPLPRTGPAAGFFTSWEDIHPHGWHPPMWMNPRYNISYDPMLITESRVYKPIRNAPPEHNKYSAVFINGIRTTLKQGMEMAGACTRALNLPVNLFYNERINLGDGLVNVHKNHMRIFTTCAQDFRNYLALEVMSGKDVFVFSHSLGGAITNVALQNMDPHHKEHIHVTTFGSAQLVPKRGLMESQNYVSKGDLIAKGSQGFHVGYNFLEKAHGGLLPTGQKEDVPITYLKPHRWFAPFVEHSFMGETYQGALKKSCHRIERKYLSLSP